MRIVRYQKDNEIFWGEDRGDGAYRRLTASPLTSLDLSETSDNSGEVALLCPVDPTRIFGVGLNYVLHIEESGAKAPKFPMLFMKPSTSVIGPEDSIVYPHEGQNTHFEAELAVVIGRKARRVNEADALDTVLGYTCANDVSERVIQSAEMGMGTLLIGKGYDTFCPLGPAIVTGLDPSNLKLEARVNGETRQSSSTSDLLFSVPKLISYLSQAVTLLPGDVIITGTPSGVGPIVPGDEVEIEVEGIGVLRNPVVAEAS